MEQDFIENLKETAQFNDWQTYQNFCDDYREFQQRQELEDFYNEINQCGDEDFNWKIRQNGLNNQDDEV